jgi:predicted Zn-dependent protease
MMKWIGFFMVMLFAFSCNEVDRVFGKNETPKEISYSYACLDSALGGKPINQHLERAGGFIRNLAVSEKKVTDSVQSVYGAMFHDEMISEGTFKLINDKALQQNLNNVLQRLLAARAKPSGINYKIYALEDTTINAFTFGGRIYMTRAMLNKCSESESLLYAIVGHEIGHSEAGHIKATIQEMMISNKVFGEANGPTLLGIKRLLTASTNQKNELEADYYGINLTNELGYDVCTAVAFWKEMASKENSYNQVEDFFRTHPFSNLRSQCLTDHIMTNFRKNCGSINNNHSLPQVVKS